MLPMPNHSQSLVPAPGLPAKPASAPNISFQEMQQLHRGQAPHGLHMQHAQPSPLQSMRNGFHGLPPTPLTPSGSASEERAQTVEAPELKADAQEVELETAEVTIESLPQEQVEAALPSTNAAVDEAARDRQREDMIGFVYTDNEETPEEKMAKIARYSAYLAA